MSLSLERLLAGVEYRLDGDAKTAVTGVTADSRRVQEGSVFVAVRGHAVDGHGFVPGAIAAGAVAVVVEDAGTVDPSSGVEVVTVESTRVAFGAMLRRWYDFPDRALDVIAVTGTNGKTTVSHLVRDLMNACGMPCGLLGTIRYDDLREEIPAPLTTPGPEDLVRHISTMRDAGGVGVAMEASSHALDQQRLAGIEVDVAAFTNVTRDHLDYHGDLDAYLLAKRRLLDHIDSPGREKPRGRAVVFVDDPTLGAQSWPANTITVGRAAGCTVRLHALHTRGDGSSLDVEIDGVRRTLESRLLGGYNGANLLVTVGIAHALGIALEDVADAFDQLRPVPGRLEPVDLENGPVALVDYAHTPDGLCGALDAVMDLTAGRVHLVFGCGGDRDRGKRAQMAEIAAARADRIVITLDNPRTEDPEQIFGDMMDGFGGATDRVHRVDDRQAAIEDALSATREGDVILVAGKGHETYQILGTDKLPWDDRDVLRAAWNRVGGSA